MCGITGIFNPNGLPDKFRDKELLKQMTINNRITAASLGNGIGFQVHTDHKINHDALENLPEFHGD
ncbi:hypothetical protein QUF70_10630 [Desulfobacterales bacterium HSG17]|nr:hypothetical protein [Desulfobacterales bacterium HSG17]